MSPGDGDGRCDVLSVDRKTGNVDIWYNKGVQGSVPTFSYKAGVVTGNKCTEGWGIGPFDFGVQFADVNGDGRVDYLCMEQDGRTTGYLNTDSGLEDVGQIKRSEGHERASHRWADVDGDGRADFLYTDIATGDTIVWLNEGEKTSGDSAFTFQKIDNAFPKAVDQGANIHFVKMSNSGRADMVRVLPDSGVAYTYFNECKNPNEGSDGPGPDDGSIVDPKLEVKADLCRSAA